jgi:hypothetical protein
MTYKEYFVVEVKANGKILRVRDGAVYLPFGSEYSILLKNLNTRKASVNVSVDGQDALDNSHLIIEPNGETVLEGFLSGNVARNRFRFIHKTKQIQEHRGDRADDGMIRIEFAYEKIQPKPWIQNTIKEVHHYHHNPFQYTYYGDNSDWNIGSPVCDIYNSSGEQNTFTVQNSAGESKSSESTASSSRSLKESNVTMDSLGIADVPLADEGITVKGSECRQEFRYGYIGELEDPEVIVIQLKGLTETGNQVSQPVTIQSKLTCPTCGTKSKSSMKYCGNCGTFLE